MIRIEAAIETAEQRLHQEIAKAADVVRNEYQAAVAHEASLVSALEAQKVEALRLNRQDLEYGRLQRDAESNRQIYDTLLQQARQLGIASEFRQSSIRVVDRAEVPTVPVRPERTKMGLFALAMGVFAAIGIAVMRESLDSRIKTPQDVQHHLSLPFVGLVPAVAVAEEEEGPYFTVEATPFSEALRRVRNTLTLSTPRPGPQVLLVTSSAPREGKSTIVVGLAQAFAASAQRVLVVDTDFRRSRITRLLELDLRSAFGLSDYLSKKTETLTDIVHATSVDNLWVVPAGRVHTTPSELLGLPRLGELLEVLRGRFDWILIDSAPVLSVSETPQVAHLADGVLFVVGAEMALRRDVQQAERLLMVAGTPFAGVVLNRAPVDRHAYYYARYYNKGYQSYYQETA
jgi:capsular exopolysaccharide synthesis family protein